MPSYRNCHIATTLTIVYFEGAYQPPITFDVPLENGFFVFGENKMFYEFTRFPGVEVKLFDAESGDFKPLITAGALKVDLVLHPWVIVLAYKVREWECPELSACISVLKTTREEAGVIMEEEELLEVENAMSGPDDQLEPVYNFDGTYMIEGGAGDARGVKGNRYEVQEEIVASITHETEVGVGTDTEIEEKTYIGSRAGNCEPSLMPVFVDDPNDLDYVDSGSEATDGDNTSVAGMRGTDESDEAMETEDEDISGGDESGARFDSEDRVVVDLTQFSEAFSIEI